MAPIGSRLLTISAYFVHTTAFLPAPLPPDPAIQLDLELAGLLELAGTAVGRLDGAARLVQNPELFVGMYVRREAVLSAQIEGTQSTLEDVLQFEVDPDGREIPKDVIEVVNGVAFPTARRLIEHFIELALLNEVTGHLRNRRFRYDPYLALFAETPPAVPARGAPEPA